jgi:hypothetical protein
MLKITSALALVLFCSSAFAYKVAVKARVKINPVKMSHTWTHLLIMADNPNKNEDSGVISLGIDKPK